MEDRFGSIAGDSCICHQLAVPKDHAFEELYTGLNEIRAVLPECRLRLASNRPLIVHDKGGPGI